MPNKCFLGFCSLDLLVENCQSLKEKRRVVLSLKEKLKNRHNVAVCEFGDLSLWQRAQIGFTACSNEQKNVDSVMKAAIEFVGMFHSVTLLNSQCQIISLPANYHAH